MNRFCIVLLGLICSFPLIGTAQKMHISPELGLNTIHLGKTETGNDFQLGVQAGVNFSYRFNENFSLKTGLYLAQKKQRYSSESSSSLLEDLGGLLGNIGIPGLDSLDIPGVNLDINEKIDGVASPFYLELPLMASFDVEQFSFVLGPTVGVLLGTQNKQKITTTIPLFEIIELDSLDDSGLLSLFLPPAESVTSNTNSSIENFARWDVGAIAGIGYTIDKFQLNLLYSQSFLDYRDERGDNNRRAHRAFRVSLAYNFAVPAKGKN